MTKIPGGKLASRPLHFLWLIDTSGSMSLEGKIEALNKSLSEALPSMRQVASDNPNAEVIMRCIKFSHGAEWHIGKATKLEQFEWKDVEADKLQVPTVDVVFMLDTSGSMSGEIDGVKRSCDLFADQIIKEGVNVRLGLVCFDIGGHKGKTTESYKVYDLKRYTIGVWPLSTPNNFKRNVSSLSIGLFGGGGCYLANHDTVDIYPHIINAFDHTTNNPRVLVIISDEMGNTSGVPDFVSQLKGASITAHVLGVPGKRGAHESIAEQTGGQFWSIFEGDRYDFSSVLVDKVALTIAKETSKLLSSGKVSLGTDMGAALHMVAEEMRIPPMDNRGLPPVIALISDGQPTDDFDDGLRHLMAQPWGKKAVRIAIAIGKDADLIVLQKFIGNPELQPLQANNPESLIRYIRWASTVALKVASSPANLGETGVEVFSPFTIPPEPPSIEQSSDDEVW